MNLFFQIQVGALETADVSTFLGAFTLYLAWTGLDWTGLDSTRLEKGQEALRVEESIGDDTRLAS